jgi:hypothetical protein
MIITLHVLELKKRFLSKKIIIKHKYDLKIDFYQKISNKVQIWFKDYRFNQNLQFQLIFKFLCLRILSAVFN